MNENISERSETEGMKKFQQEKENRGTPKKKVNVKGRKKKNSPEERRLMTTGYKPTKKSREKKTKEHSNGIAFVIWRDEEREP
jgi:hypothetical protein